MSNKTIECSMACDRAMSPLKQVKREQMHAGHCSTSDAPAALNVSNRPTVEKTLMMQQ